MGDGEKKFQEVAEKLKTSLSVEKEQKEIAEKEAIVQLQKLADNPVLREMYNSNSQIGSENFSGETPILKVHSTGRSENVLIDGSQPNDGWFFYKPTQEQFETVNCHILTISKGFRAESLSKDANGKSKIVFTQILGGVLIDGKDFKPFIMYLTGVKLSPTWDFGREIKKYTHAKPVGIPMFALIVKIKSVRQKTDYGFAWSLNYEIQKDETGYPVLILDEGEFQFLRDHVEMVDETINSIISAKGTNNQNEASLTYAKTTSSVANPQDVVPDDIPF